AMLERSGLTETQLKQQLELQKTSLEALKRQTYRDFFVSTYMQSRITPLTDQIGHQDIRQYYEDHRNEFQTVDRVVWEDIFLATGTKRCPTMAEARQLGDHLVARLRAGEPFNKLTQYDDGDSRLRGGKGYGQRRGEIRPRELEKYLFQMQSGQIGPVVELSTGVHVFRVVERDFAGQIPFSEEVQDQIRQKLRNELTAREFRRIIRELSSRAVLEVNPDSLR
ncbi:MAG: peptidylprolyl isomerase, partial [Bdellovibrionales bacterium]